MGWFIFFIICGCVFGYITKTMNEKKGYEGGFLWGFFLGVIGIIVVACKSEKKINYLEEKAILSNGGWKCYKCGTVNPSDKRTCRCGVSKQEHESTIQAEEKAREKEESEKELLNMQKLKTYQELLTLGTISQEEFDKKKAELLKEESEKELLNLQKLKSYKDLLDAGAISEEEFEKKKAELLG